MKVRPINIAINNIATIINANPPKIDSKASLMIAQRPNAKKPPTVQIIKLNIAP